MSDWRLEKDWIYRGFRCAVTSSDIGHRCGYVGINHPHKLYCDTELSEELQAHGGITYAKEDRHYPVASNNLWWIGFDCAHLGDAPDPELLNDKTKQLYRLTGRSQGTVKTLQFCIDECHSIVDQIILGYGEAYVPVSFEDDLFHINT